MGVHLQIDEEEGNNTLRKILNYSRLSWTLQKYLQQQRYTPILAKENAYFNEGTL